MVSTFLTSVGAMAAGFVANRISPVIQPTVPTKPEVKQELKAEPEPEVKPDLKAELKPEPDQTQTVTKMFDVDEKVASDIIELFTLNEAVYAEKDKNEANDKLKTVYEVMSKCSDKLETLCSVIDKKIRNIAFIYGNTTQDNAELLGDQSVLLNKFVNEFRKNKK
jgi:hypothetical protein